MLKTRRKKSKGKSGKILGRRILSAPSRMSLLASVFTARDIRLVTRKMKMTIISLALVRDMTFVYHCSTQELKKQMQTELKAITEDRLKNRSKLGTWTKPKVWTMKQTTIKKMRKDGQKIVSLTKLYPMPKVKVKIRHTASLAKRSASRLNLLRWSITLATWEKREASNWFKMYWASEYKRLSQSQRRSKKPQR